ncbi:sulfatase-like hydrolase/transferase [Rhodohalobacter sp. WB101]|uniref:Sulfatase-like hydrolase/transferase n=2 Tax=Rhodohalobacter sulfatireducens TaxID=2911366 RepID=A0ABS9KHA3_9BACT|nr:sulfatase-like hydrolase/transferase [Rhodohalobacter sulfatireducens]
MINMYVEFEKNIQYKHLYWIVTLLLLIPVVSIANSSTEVHDRPNIVLLVSEDNSVHYMVHFSPGGAKTPNIETLAEAGITFDRAFSNSPVCSVARSAVMNGVYAPRTATHHHRAIEKVTMPEGWEMFPHYLREQGYFTVVNGKKDFNMMEGNVWDEDGNEAHWNSRPNENTPFFYMEQTGPDTHESRLHFNEETFRTQSTVHDPDEVEVFPYFPDTELLRYTHATYLDRHLDIDKKVGQVLTELEKDGLMENTIIIYYGDHGGVLPRSKGYVYESGLHVPLVVYIPEKFKHLSPFKPGSRVKGFVEFVDLGPTILNLAGVGLPAHMDGVPFLGKDVSAEQVNERDETFSYADRFDEKYDMVRALRKGDYKYIRNFHPFYPDGLWNRYRYIQLAYRQWRDAYKDGELNSVQRHFFEERQPEALYDISSDPHETKNLADDPEYAEVLEEMRSRLRLRMRSMPDLGLFPESYLVKNAVQDPLSFAQKNTTRITELSDIADLTLLPYEQVKSDLKLALEADDPLKRYWALISCSVFGEEAEEMIRLAKDLIYDGSPVVRIRAAEFLGIIGDGDPMSILYDIVNTRNNESDVLLALNTMTYLRDHLGYEVNPGSIEPVVDSRQIGWRIEHLGNRE